LRGVLIPFTLEQNLKLITGCGWHSAEVLFRWHSWAVIGAYASLY
jgi:tRNA (cmo5U34)-methyltransferase